MPRNIELRNLSLSTIQILHPTKAGAARSLSYRRHKQPAAFVHACLKKRSAKASFTLEAAVAVPVFTCFLVAVLFFFRVIEVQQNLFEAMQYTARTLSASAFAEAYGISGDVQTVPSYASAQLMVHSQYKSNFADQGEAYRNLPAGAAGLSLLSSDTAGDYIDLKAHYALKLPIDLFGRKVFLCAQEVKARKWNGYQAENGETESDDEIWVYITPHGTVYHMDRNCHYLDLSIKSIPEGSIAAARNKEGSCYYPCELCGRRNVAGLRYVTDYGTSYHTSLTCSGLKRSIYMVRLSESEGRGPCSKCGGG